MTRFALAALAAAGCVGASALAGGDIETLRAEMVASGINRPVFVTYAPGDYKRLADDQDLRDECGQNGVRLIERELSWNIIIRNWLTKLRERDGDEPSPRPLPQTQGEVTT